MCVVTIMQGFAKQPQNNIILAPSTSHGYSQPGDGLVNLFAHQNVDLNANGAHELLPNSIVEAIM